MASRTSWRKELVRCLEDTKQTWADIVAVTLTESELDKLFHPGHGGREGLAFTAWTKQRVYFPVVYDGAEWVGSAPRDPCDEATGHVGGQ